MKKRKSDNTKREAAKLRKKRQLERVKEAEIREGVRSPGGTKRKVSEIQYPICVLPDSVIQIKDLELADRGPANIAELTWPARALKEKIRSKKTNPKGSKQKNEARPAKYHNWHTPFCWSQIKIAAKKVGWKMSASAIVQALNRMDPNTFSDISHMTIEGWIDLKGPKPRWSDAVLKKVEQGLGNDPGHSKGGRRGILVRNQYVKKKLRKTDKLSGGIP